MSEQSTTAGPPRPPRRSRFSFAELGRALVAPIVAVVLFIFLFGRHAEPRRSAANGVQRVTLAQKDPNFHIVPPSRGGATGSVWYHARGPALAFQLRAAGLVPRRRYLLELSVDGTIYTVTSHPAAADGTIALDTAITELAEGACVGDNYDPPHSVRGPHEIKFWLKNDGNPTSGTMPGRSPAAAHGASLPCHGNGDGNYQYVLLENAVAHFDGTPH